MPFAHPGLASALDMQGYWNEIHGNVSLQCSPLASEQAPADWADLASARTAGAWKSSLCDIGVFLLTLYLFFAPLFLFFFVICLVKGSVW